MRGGQRGMSDGVGGRIKEREVWMSERGSQEGEGELDEKRSS